MIDPIAADGCEICDAPILVRAKYGPANRFCSIRCQRQSWSSRRSQESREKARARNRREHIERKYGISEDEYNELLSKPCRICGAESQHLDHSHKTGQNRAALCAPCNFLLGLVHDDADRLRAAAAYLEETA